MLDQVQSPLVICRVCVKQMECEAIDERVETSRGRYDGIVALRRFSEELDELDDRFAELLVCVVADVDQ